MKKHNMVIFSIVLFALILMANQGFTQSIRTGTIKGTTTDETGEILPGVTVEIIGKALMASRAITTDSNGAFRFYALPVGRGYEVTFSLAGFQTLARKNLRISIGATIILDVVLNPSTVEEEITVTAEAPLVDTAKSSFSSTVDAQILETLPTRRYSFLGIIQSVPGATPSSPGSSRISAFGSGSQDNAYYMNGVDLSAPSTGAAWNWPMPDSIEEIEVTGVGAPAQYGQFTGAIINVISKSGSNTFHGAVKYYFQNEKLTSINTPDEVPDIEKQWPWRIDHWHDAIFQLGGPVVKDKLWFYVSVQHKTDRSSGVGANPDLPGESRMNPSAVVKIDFQITPKNKLSFFADYENWLGGATPTATRPIECVSQEQAPAMAPTLEWLSMLSDKTYFELKYGGFYTFLKYDPVDDNFTDPGHMDVWDGQRSVNSTYFYHWKTNRSQINATLTHYADDFIKGSHEFKFGAQYAHGLSDMIEGYWGGVAYYDWQREPYYAYFRAPSHSGGTNDQFALFMDDTWAVSDRLTLNLGVRFDYNKGSIPDFDELDSFEQPTGTKIAGIPDVADWKNISPRLGLNYQLTNDRKTVFRATYGRYYNALIIGDYASVTPAQATLYVYEYNPATAAYDILWWTWTPLTDRGLDPDLKPEYADQFSVAIERELLPNLSVSATLIYKKTKNIITSLNTAAEYDEVQVYDEYGDQYFTAYDQVLPLDNFRLTTNPGNESTYKGLMLVANKRFANNFSFFSSFTWSKAWDVPKGYTNKNSLINAEGPTSRDRRWMFKIGGSYLLPFGMVFGTNVIYQQGSPWQRTFRTRLNQGNTTINAEPRGTRRNPNLLYFDLKIEKRINISGSARAKISIDIINLFNKNTPRSYRNSRADNPNWMVPGSIQLPRRAMIGLILEF